MHTKAFVPLVQEELFWAKADGIRKGKGITIFDQQDSFSRATNRRFAWWSSQSNTKGHSQDIMLHCAWHYGI